MAGRLTYLAKSYNLSIKQSVLCYEGSADFNYSAQFLSTVVFIFWLLAIKSPCCWVSCLFLLSSSIMDSIVSQNLYVGTQSFFTVNSKEEKILEMLLSCQDSTLLQSVTSRCGSLITAGGCGALPRRQRQISLELIHLKAANEELSGTPLTYLRKHYSDQILSQAG